MTGCTYAGLTPSQTLKTWQNIYIYGPDGLRRYAKATCGNESTTTTSCLDGQSVVQEAISRAGQAGLPASETVTYLTGPRSPEYRRSEVSAGTNTTTSTRWYAYDGLGSVLGEIDGDAGSPTFGDLKKSRVYDAYGNVRAEDAAYSASGHRFVGALGHPSAGETGLIYMRARYMDPAVRYVTVGRRG